jgi:hypothetical protein
MVEHLQFMRRLLLFRLVLTSRRWPSKWCPAISGGAPRCLSCQSLRDTSPAGGGQPPTMPSGWTPRRSPSSMRCDSRQGSATRRTSFRVGRLWEALGDGIVQGQPPALAWHADRFGTALQKGPRDFQRTSVVPHRPVQHEVAPGGSGRGAPRETAPTGSGRGPWCSRSGIRPLARGASSLARWLLRGTTRGPPIHGPRPGRSRATFPRTEWRSASGRIGVGPGQALEEGPSCPLAPRPRVGWRGAPGSRPSSARSRTDAGRRSSIRARISLGAPTSIPTCRGRASSQLLFLIPSASGFWSTRKAPPSRRLEHARGGTDPPAIFRVARPASSGEGTPRHDMPGKAVPDRRVHRHLAGVPIRFSRRPRTELYDVMRRMTPMLSIPRTADSIHRVPSST